MLDHQPEPVCGVAGDGAGSCQDNSTHSQYSVSVLYLSVSPSPHSDQPTEPRCLCTMCSEPAW